MRIVSWNIDSLKGGPEKIVAAVLHQQPTLVAFQEFPSGNKPGSNAVAVERMLATEGLVPFRREAKARPFRTIVFGPAETRLVAAPPELEGDDPFWVDVQFGGVGLSAAHIAIPQNAGLREMHWRTALSLIASKADTAHILIGDLNTTRHGIDQEGATISGDHFLRTLEAAGWRDAWRATHAAPVPREYSWYYKKIGFKEIGFRFDQAWLSPALAPRLLGARMNHEVREQGLSDHSMLVVELDA